MQRTAGCQAPVLGREIGPLLPRRRVGSLDEEGAEPGTALARLAAVALARALVVARTHAGPGGEMLGAGEAGRVRADLGHQRLSHLPADPGDRIQAGEGILDGAQAGGDP